MSAQLALGAAAAASLGCCAAAATTAVLAHLREGERERLRRSRAGVPAQGTDGFATTGRNAKVLARLLACEARRTSRASARGPAAGPVRGPAGTAPHAPSSPRPPGFRAGVLPGRAGLEAAIASAGLSGRVGPEAVRGLALRFAGVAAAVTAPAAYLVADAGGLFAVPFACVWAASLPRRALAAEARARGEALVRELPDALELMALGLRAGMGFDAAFALYPQAFDGVFAREMEHAQRRWNFGLVSRPEALEGLASAFDSPALSNVCSAWVRALEFGTPLAPRLETFASDARQVREAAAQEAIAKAPVKMLAPVTLLMLPALLLFVLGPVVLDLARGI